MDPSGSVANGFRKKERPFFAFSILIKETLPFSSLHNYQVPKTLIYQAKRWMEERTVITNVVRMVKRKLILGGEWTWEEWSL